jgi:hypothetical protein
MVMTGIGFDRYFKECRSLKVQNWLQGHNLVASAPYLENLKRMTSYRNLNRINFNSENSLVGSDDGRGRDRL